jgi:hypothetical protein
VILAYVVIALSLTTTPLMHTDTRLLMLYGLAGLLGVSIVLACVCALKALQWRAQWAGRGVPEVIERVWQCDNAKE